MIVILLLLAATIVASHLLVPPYVEGSFNRTTSAPPFDRASERAKRLHETLEIADLHADSLVWGRDLLDRASRGQADVPRLLEGNVTLQVFSVPTQVPRRRSQWGTDPDQLNLMTLSALAQLWPPPAWWSLEYRAAYLAGLLRRQARRSEGRLVFVAGAPDLAGYLEQPRPPRSRVAGVLALEGLQCLEGNLEAVDRLFQAGYRIMGLVHQFDNRVGGSSYGLERGGLTPFGRQVIERIDQLGAIVDLAHASPKLIEDVLRVSTRPPVVSHTGVRGTCDRRRNLSDQEVVAIARRGGLIGIGFWSGAICDREPEAIVRAIRHVVKVAGIDAVGLGSDFDGGTATHFDASGLVQITQALLNAGFDETEIRKIMGGNLLRFLRNNLPDR